MATARISTLLILLFSYWTIHVVAANDRGPPFSHLQRGDVTCWRFTDPRKRTIKPLIEDCYAAFRLIPSGRLTFGGGDPPVWSIESPARRKKFLPAAFTYKTCTIRVQGHGNTPLPRTLDSPARTMYYHVWPAAREAAERVLQQCMQAGAARGCVTQTLTFDGHGPYHLGVDIGNFGATMAPRYHVYDAATREE
jgi:hypothetical protein